MASQPKSFEEQLAKLQEIVTKLQQGNVSLNDSIELFKEGMTLSNDLKGQLNEAETTLAQMMDEMASCTRPKKRAMTFQITGCKTRATSRNSWMGTFSNGTAVTRTSGCG